MIRRALHLALLLALSAALLGAIWPRRPVLGGGGGWYSTCDGSSDTDTVYCMDFEGTGCADTDGGDTCNSGSHNGTTDSDCTSGTGDCPLEQDESYRFESDFAGLRSQSGDGDGFGFTIGTGDIIRCAVTFEEEDEGTVSSGDAPWWRMYNGSSNTNVYVLIDYINEEVCVRNGSGTETCSSAGFYTDGSPISFCWEYDYDSDKIDLYDTDDCSGTPVATSDGSSSTGFDGYRFFNNDGGMLQIIDNIKCEENPA